MRKQLLFLGGMLLFLVNHILSQGQVTGKVTDTSGSPLSGATIKVKNSNAGTITGADGTFKINAESTATLVVSSVNYESKEIAVNGASEFNIQLAPDIKLLGEVVLTGTGIPVSKRRLAIAVETVDVGNQTKVPSSGVFDQLVGQIPGAHLASVSGWPGMAPSILLRGINTIEGGTTPMILLDGVQIGVRPGFELNAIDLNTIEKVEVVQGAAAATLYGAQGANGVIQLFSKRGRQGLTLIDVSMGYTTTQFLNNGKVAKNHFHSYETNANNEVVGASTNQPLVWDPAIGAYTDNIIYNALDPLATSSKPYDKNLVYYDHYKMFWKTGHNKNASLSISGGKEKMDFAITASYNHQESNIKNSGALGRGNFTTNIGAELFQGLKFRSVTQFTYDKLTVNSDQQALFELNNTRPFANYDDTMSNGEYSRFYGPAAGINGRNPNYRQSVSSLDQNNLGVVQSFNLDYKFKKFLAFEVRYGLNLFRRNIQYFYADQTANPNLINFGPASYGIYSFEGGFAGEIDDIKVQSLLQNLVTSVTITTDFKKDFHLNIPLRTSTLIAYDYRDKESTDYFVYGVGEPYFEPFTLANYSTQRVVNDEKVPFVTYGILANQRFEYGEIAGISVGFRSDYSSAFGRGSKPQTFPRFDGFVRPAQLDFWKRSAWLPGIIPDWKLRMAYGEAGIQPGPFDRYPTLATGTFGASQALSFPNTIANPDLGVEISKELEIGTDMYFKIGKNNWFGNLLFTFTYWDRTTDNAIYTADVAPSLGVGSFLQNAFTLASHGIQAQVNTTVLSNKKMNWGLTVNFSKQTSEITKVIGSDVILASSAGNTNYILRPGLKIGQLFGYRMLRTVDQKDAAGNYVIPPAEHKDHEVASNGYVVNKTTKRPVVDPNRSDFGDPNPKFNMAFINDLSYKGFLTFSMQWDWVYKSHLYNQTKSWMYRDGIHADYDKPITINGESGAWTAFYRGVYQAGGNNATKDYFYEDATFLRLRNISIGFDIARFHPIKGIRKLQLVLIGRNLVTVTDYTGFDPEINSGAATTFPATNSAWDRGTDHNTMPNLKYLTVGLNVGF